MLLATLTAPAPRAREADDAGDEREHERSYWREHERAYRRRERGERTRERKRLAPRLGASRAGNEREELSHGHGLP